MPKGTSKPDKNWGVMTMQIGINGLPVHRVDGKVLKMKVRINNGEFNDGSLQPFYFPTGHEHAGLFKGMAMILAERGLLPDPKLRV
jgi:hypothetical protein